MQFVDRCLHGTLIVDEIAVGAREAAQRVAQRLLPGVGVARLRPVVAQVGERPHETPPAAERRRVAAFGIGGGDTSGDDGVARRWFVAKRVGEEQPVQAIGEAVPLGGRQIESAAAARIQAPTDAGIANPVVDALQVIGFHAELRRHRGLLQEVEDGAGSEAAAA